MNEPQTELAKNLQLEVYQLRAENEELRKSLQQNQTMNDTPETQAAFLLFDTGEQGLHYVSEQMRRIERERDQLRQWTSVNGVLELERERDQYQAAMARYLEAYRKEQSKNQELEKKLEAFNQNMSQPLRTAYSRKELSEVLTKWMIKRWGNSPENLPPCLQDRFYRDNGMIHDFIADHFPTEKKEP